MFRLLKMEFIQCSSFAVNHGLNYDFFLKDKIHASNIGLRQLSKDFISHVRLKNVSILSSRIILNLFQKVRICLSFYKMERQQYGLKVGFWNVIEPKQN